MKRTAIYDAVVESNGKMVEFAGWEMAVQFSGIVDEHMTVRKHVGIFDVSHMGDVMIRGEGALPLLESLCTRNIGKGKLGAARYTHMLDEQGRILDDMLVTPMAKDYYFVVPNAATTPRILEWMAHNVDKYAQGKPVQIDNVSDLLSCIAVQGPKAQDAVHTLVGADLSKVKKWNTVFAPAKFATNATADDLQKCFPHLPLPTGGAPAMLASRTGYTGEDGFELIMPNAMACDAWRELVKFPGLKPIGLGARDTLRLEKGFLLSGTDFSMDRSTVETGYDWVIDFEKDFVGKARMVDQRAKGHDVLTGLKLDVKGIPRHGFDVVMDGKVVSHVTSGGMSPVMNCGIAMCYLPASLRAPGMKAKLVSGARQMDATVVPMPFV